MKPLIPALTSYQAAELQEASRWPAIARYLNIREQLKPVEFQDQLRLNRNEAWLECALATYFRSSSTELVCRYWSEAAIKHISLAAEHAELNPEQIVIFALGKLGSHELNLSSDVDLIVVSDNVDDTNLRRLQKMARILSAMTEFGFCHRVDFDLRPGGKSSPILTSLGQFENHYAYQAETWERLALVRSRAVFGTPQFLESLTDSIQKFTYRKYLDYSVLDEIRLLLDRIRNEYPASGLSQFNLKLESGGIRDIELLCHALQVIHGGRIQALRTSSTSLALERLAKAKLLDPEEAKVLKKTYWQYRSYENECMSVNDDKNYLLTDIGPVANCRNLAHSVRNISEQAFPSTDSSVFSPQIDGSKLAVSEAEFHELIHEYRSIPSVSRRSEADRKLRDKVLADFITLLQKHPTDHRLALSLLNDFTKTTRSKGSFLSLLTREPTVLEMLVLVFSTSPWAGQLFVSRPELLEIFYLRESQSLASLPADPNELWDALVEYKMLHELMASIEFLRTLDLDKLTSCLTDIADQIVLHAMQVVCRQRNSQNLRICALGKWGGRELGVHSDLDFIFVTDRPIQETEHQVAKRLLNRLTEAHRGGPLYSVDMRLRPSGQAGPLIVTEPELTKYLQQNAAPWERQSWLRARAVADEKNRFFSEPNRTRPWSQDDDQFVFEVANQLFKVRNSKSRVDLKLTWGGLASIEFAVQAEILRNGRLKPWTMLDTGTSSMIHFLIEALPHWRKLGSRLSEIHYRVRVIEQIARITGNQAGSVIDLQSESAKRIAGALGVNEASLLVEVEELLKESHQILMQLGCYPTEKMRQES